MQAVVGLVHSLIDRIPLAYLRMVYKAFGVPNLYIWDIESRSTSAPSDGVIPWPIGFLLGSFSKKFIPRGDPAMLHRKVHDGLIQWRNRALLTAHFTEQREEDD